MHCEILVEDASGKILLESLVPKILGGPENNRHTCKLIACKGIGRLPRGLRGTSDAKKRILLDRLPKILAGYGNSLRRMPAVVVVLVEVDDRDCREFKRELLEIVTACNPRPQVLFRFAIEETEAWLMGDRTAVLAAFPHARPHALDNYAQDSVCGAWERLADALYPGGAPALKGLGWLRIGQVKWEWASKIGPHLRPETNRSRSFHVFREGLLRFTRP